MQFTKRQKKLLIFLIIPVVSMLYMHFLFIKWNSVQDIFNIIPSYLLFGFSVGLIISALPFNNPVNVAAFATIPVPLLCYIIEFILLKIIPEVNAGGPGPNVDIGSAGTILLMALGGIPLGIVAVLGCWAGLGMRSLIATNYLKSTSKNASSTEISAEYVSARATIIAGIATCVTSLAVALLT